MATMLQKGDNLIHLKLDDDLLCAYDLGAHYILRRTRSVTVSDTFQ